ncbi:ABC transporter substrate-binding protein [Corynebacterium argentoratense]
MNTSTQRSRKIAVSASGLALCGLLAACSGNTAQDASGSASTQAQGEGSPVTIVNCGEDVTYDHAGSLMVNDSNILAAVYAAGAGDKVKAVTSVNKDKDVLVEKYGKIADRDELSDKAAGLEQIIAEAPDVYVAGWNYGMTDANGVNPESLASHGIGAYVLTESCRQSDGAKRGTVEPWQAVREDLNNLGTAFGDEETAKKVIEDQDSRLDKLKAAPQADTKPVAFVFDQGRDGVFTSGRFGGPEAIITAAGATNAAGDVDDTWTTVSWEKLASTSPDVFVFVDYPGQNLEEKIEMLKTNPVTKDLPAVKEERFVNLPYVMWTSGPLNIDAAELVRKALEGYNLVPASKIQAQFQLPASVAGQNYWNSK